MTLRPFKRRREKAKSLAAETTSLALDSADSLFTLWALGDLIDLVISLADDS